MSDPAIVNERLPTRPETRSESFLTAPRQTDVGNLVLQAPEAIWKKIKKALAVQTRDEAASLVRADDKAKQRVISLLSGSDENLLTQRQTRVPLEEQMYGSRKAKVTF